MSNSTHCRTPGTRRLAPTVGAAYSRGPPRPAWDPHEWFRKNESVAASSPNRASPTWTHPSHFPVIS